MSEYVNKLLSIAEKKQKLILEEERLIEKRKFEIGLLAEKFELLTVSDTVISGLFSDLQASLKNNSEKINYWENQGAQHVAKRPHARVAQEGAK